MLIKDNFTADHIRALQQKSKLADALGPVGFARFLQQFEHGYGDYTKEKYLAPDQSMDEVAAKLFAYQGK